MSENKLTFSIFSNGRVVIDLDKCLKCSSKACIEVCNGPSGRQVLILNDEVPSLRKSYEEIEKGGCNECLGCELECLAAGENAITIELPIRNWEKYLEELEEKGLTMVYER